MKLKMDLSKEYGLVLEGGGAKGAYQIGAWKALREAGVRIKGVAGVSVGALNGALICMDDLAGALDLWENIRYSHVMSISDEVMEGVMGHHLKEVDFSQIVKDGKKIISDRGIDVAPLRKMISDRISEEKIRNSEMELYIVTYSVSDRKLLEINLKDVPDGLMEDMLLASAYYLAFRHERLHGKKYLDGRGWNNLPLDCLIENGYQDIIILRIYGYGLKRKVEIPDGTNIYNIAPRRKIGRTLEFSTKKSRRNLALGYYDGMRLLYGLQGRRYYLDMPEDEGYYFKKVTERVSMVAADNAGIGYRQVMEEELAVIAKDLALKEGWGYRELYLGVLELVALKLKVSRFHIYTEQELIEAIREGLQKKSEDAGWMAEFITEIRGSSELFPGLFLNAVAGLDIAASYRREDK